MRKQPFVVIFFCMAVLNCHVSPAHADEDITANQHYLKIRGLLPAPLGNFELEIELDPDSDDIELFHLVVGGLAYKLADTDYARLKNIELSSLKIVHPPYYQDGVSPFAIIRVRVGERYRIEFEEDGMTRFHWGKDLASVYVVHGMPLSVEISPLSRWN